MENLSRIHKSVNATQTNSETYNCIIRVGRNVLQNTRISEEI